MNEPLVFYKNPLLYTAFTTVVGVSLVIYSVVGNAIPFLIPGALISFLFGGISVVLWNTRCMHCKRAFCKKEKVEWRKDLGIIKEPYTYHSEVYRDSDGTTQDVPDSQKTIMRDKKHDRLYYVCPKCEHGSDKQWYEDKNKWLGAPPTITTLISKDYRKDGGK